MTTSELAARVRYWQERLFLHGWELEINVVEKLEGRQGAAHASVIPSQSYDHADLMFDKESLEESSDREIEVIVVHELLHVMMRDIDEAVQSGISSFTGREWSLYSAWIEHAEEGFVMRLAEILVIFDGTYQE